MVHVVKYILYKNLYIIYMPRQNCNNPGTVLVINQNNGNEMCVTAMPE